MPVNKCLLQPNHSWHAGHASAVGPIDPRLRYAARMRNKDAGRRAWLIVKEASDPKRKWGMHIHMSDMQKFLLFTAFKTALLATTLLPVGGAIPSKSFAT